MKLPLLHCALLALAAGFALPTDSAQPDAGEARQWLERMIQATQNLSYEGTFIYAQGPHVEAMRIVHRGDQDDKRQRLISLTGPPREILVTNDSVICLSSQRQATLAGGEYRHIPFPVSIPSELGRLENRYDFRMMGQDRAAGVETQVVAITPRDALRYGYRLWLDQRNGMLLRSALLDDKGYPIEQLMFTDLQIKPRIDEDAFKLPAPTGDESQTASPAIEGATPPVGTPVTRSAWKVARLPDGFVKISHNRFMEASGRHPIEHMVFADGLATISVFVERLNGAAPLLQGQSELGSMHAFGTRVDDYQILVVGEVPAATVHNIAASIAYDPETAKNSTEGSKP